MKSRVKILLFSVTFSFSELMSSGRVCSAQTRSEFSSSDPRGNSDVIVCSQNLENFGILKELKKRNSSASASALEEKIQGLVTRFIRARCDIIAVQEVLGEKESDAEESMKLLSEALFKFSGRTFDTVIGDALDGPIRTGFLTAKDRVSILSKVSYLKVELPKLTPNQKPRRFPRPPLEVQVEVKAKDETPRKNLILINMHLKSKAGGRDDPAELQFETSRMEMAEAFRRIVEMRHRQSLALATTPLLLLGDRNSEPFSASARILEGSLALKDFQDTAPCRLSKNTVPLCQEGVRRPQSLFSVLTNDPQTKLLSSYNFKGVPQWIDDILMPHVALPFAWEHFDSEGNFNSGVIASPEEASDHALVWVALNW